MSFAGRHAFVTGAAGGIGYQVAYDLVTAGCSVTAIDIKPNPGGFPDGPGRLVYLEGDLADVQVIEAAVDQAAADGLDFVVNVAGIWLQGDGSIVEMDLAIWERTLQINLMAAVHVVRRAVPHMVGRGSGGAFVHVASVAGARAMDNVLDAGPLDAYQISKAAVISLSRSLALTYGRRGIRSNTVCPGSVRTPMTEGIYQNQDRIEAMAKRTPIPRVGTPEDIAGACLFLLSDKAAFITGTDLMVDGGLMAKLV